MSNQYFPVAGGVPIQQQQQQQLSLMHQQQQQQQQQQQLRLDQFHQEQQRQIQLAAAAAAAAGGAVAMVPRTLHSQQPLSPPQQQLQLQQSFTTNDNNNNQKATLSAQTLPPTPSYTDSGDSPYSKNSWDSTILASQSGHDDSQVALSIGPDGNLVSVMPRWDGYDLSSLPPAQLVSRPNNTKVLTQQQQQQQQQQQDILPRGGVAEFGQQPHPSVMVQQQRQYFTQGQGPQQQQQQALQQQQQQPHPHQQHQKQLSYQEQQQPIYSPGQELFANDYLFDAPSPVPTMSSLDMGIPIVPSQQQQQQQSQSQPQQLQQLHASPSPLHVPEYIKTSCSPEMPIKASPVDQLAWAPWEDLAAHPDDQVTYATPAHTHTSFDDNPRVSISSLTPSLSFTRTGDLFGDRSIERLYSRTIATH
ncbi:hypothetical protein F5H01DRAFT_111878 [Linnemannia elongata]|nr:hypothetical protein F5H01DRAFT_111878 [Linnemannia elongata]